MKIGDRVRIKDKDHIFEGQVGKYKAIMKECGKDEYIVQFSDCWSYFDKSELEVIGEETPKAKQKNSFTK